MKLWKNTCTCNPKSNQFKMDGWKWWFPTISYVKVGNHPSDSQAFINGWPWGSRYIWYKTIFTWQPSSWCLWGARVLTLGPLEDLEMPDLEFPPIFWGKNMNMLVSGRVKFNMRYGFSLPIFFGPQYFSPIPRIRFTKKNTLVREDRYPCLCQTTRTKSSLHYFPF